MLTIAYNLSGALEAVKMGRFVILVDVIDMSTTQEALWEAGAKELWGAAPSHKKNPYTDPFLIGRTAARWARENGCQLEIVAEPRAGSWKERRERCADVLAGVAAEGLKVSRIWVNLGAETAKFTDWRDKGVITVSDCGGLIYDAVWQLGGGITTATVARTLQMKGTETARRGLERALQKAQGRPLTLVAASSNALEDVLAVQYLAQLFFAEYLR